MLLLRSLRIPLFGLLAICLLTACNDGSIYSKFRAVEGHSWSYGDTLTFVPEIKDSTGQYDILLMLRYKKDYEFSNLWLMTRHNLEGRDTLQRVEVSLFYPDGSPRGKILGNNCSIEAVWKRDVPLYAGDSVYIQLVQHMRKDPLEGIMDAGVKIIPIK